MFLPDAPGVSFQLREGLFGRAQIGRVWWQVEEPAAVVTQGLCCLRVAVRGQVVQDDDSAGRDFLDEDFSDVGGKCRAIHRALDDPRRNQRVLGQTRDQRLRSPTAKRSVHGQPLSLTCPAPEPGEVRLSRRFVNEHHTVWHPGDGWRTISGPIVALSSYLGATAFGGHQRLFLCVKPRRFSNPAMAE